MTPINFAYWLQGFFEISEVQDNEITLTPEQVKMIRAHLNLVFFHAIDPETLKDKSELEKLKYQKIHDGAKSGDVITKKEFDDICEIVKSKEQTPAEKHPGIILQDFPKAYYDDSQITYNC